MGDYSELDSTYVIEEQIGSGSGGIVYKAYHKRLRKDVVLKQIKGNASHINVRAETDILKKLKDPYLPQVLDYLEYEGTCFTVMEFIEGRSLQQFLNEGVKFRQKPVIKWMLQLTQALETLHGQNPPIIHGDIKPANIMLTPRGNICLIDFNISGEVNGDEIRLMGYTGAYASPEQIAACEAMKRKQKSSMAVDGRSDLYSLGATMCYLLTGRKDCARGHTRELLEAVTPQLSDALIHILVRLTSLKKEDRYKDAESLEKSLLCIKKADNRYRSLVMRQTAGLMLVAAMAVGCALMAVLGHFRMQEEREERYESIVEEIGDAWTGGDYTEAERLYEQAAAMDSGRYEAYLEKARWLYDEKEYKACIGFIENEALKKLDYVTDSGDLYYVLANCCFETEDYEAAVDAYAEAVNYKTDKGLYYSDYAIALARLGRTDYAKKRLDKAVELGIDKDSTYYARGEINVADGKYEPALEDFLTCIGDTDDGNMRRRAYLMAAGIYLRNPDQEDCQNCIDLMNQARVRLPLDDTPGVLEYLAQAYMNMSAITRDSRYDDQALGVLQDIIDMGWGNYITHQNIAVLYQKKQQYDLALKELGWMLDQYGEDYNIYKKMALIEVLVQEQKSSGLRDYSQFQIYYDKAVGYYGDRKDTGQTDPEMQVLNNLYVQARSGGWLQ